MKKLSEHFTIDELTHSYAAVENGTGGFEAIGSECARTAA